MSYCPELSRLVLRSVGRGASGIVFFALRDGELLAVKAFRDEERFLAQACDEVSTLRKVQELDCEHLQRLEDVFGHETQIFVATAPLTCPLSILLPLVQEPAAPAFLPAAGLQRLGRQQLGALQTLHASGLVHGDVKPSNLLWDGAHARVVLIDFGMSFHEASGPHQMAQSSGYRAPEAIDWNRSFSSESTNDF
eukprot:gene4212-5189_t